MRSRSVLIRHLVILVLAVILSYAFLLSRAEWSPMHKWNRAMGDVSLVLVAFAMALGPLSRIWRARIFRQMLPYRRELGIYAVVAAVIHTIIILLGWVELDFARLFGFEWHPQLERYVMFQKGFGLANAIGLLAVGYGLILALTSNDLSQRLLSQSVWKFIQQGTYVLWALALVHTAYFLFIHFLDFHRQTPAPNWAQWPFIALMLSVLTLQTVATLKTWRLQRAKQGAGPQLSRADG